MAPRLQILAATYRTLNVTDIIRNEVRSKKPYGTITIDLWSIIPWHNPGLITAPGPETLVVVLRIALARGCYTDPRVTVSGPNGLWMVKFDRTMYLPSYWELVSSTGSGSAKRLSLVSATYIDTTLGSCDVTSIVRPFFTTFAARDSSSLVIPVTDRVFGPSTPCTRANRNQITITYWCREAVQDGQKEGKITFNCIAGGWGDRLIIAGVDVGKGDECLETFVDELRRAEDRKCSVDLKTRKPSVVEVSLEE